MKEKNKINILMITVRADHGGGPEHVWRLMQYFPEGQLNMHVACPKEAPYWQRFAAMVGEEHMLEIPHRRFTIIYLLQMIRFMRRCNIQLIHSHGKGAGVYGRIVSLLTNKPCVHTFHGLHIEKYKSWQKKLYLWIERILSRYSRHLIAVSHGEAEMVKSLQVCDYNKLTVVTNGVSIPTQFATMKAAKRPVRPLKVISMSRFDYQKNSELIIPIIEYLRNIGRIDDFEFILLGDGEGRANLGSLLEKCGIAKWVALGGAVSNPEEYLQTAFCYLSTSRWEGMPLGVLEAMGAAVPVIATNVVGNRDAVTHGKTGYLYPLAEPEQAGQMLCKLVDDDICWQELSQNAREQALEKYSAERMAKETLSVYFNCFYK